MSNALKRGIGPVAGHGNNNNTADWMTVPAPKASNKTNAGKGTAGVVSSKFIGNRLAAPQATVAAASSDSSVASTEVNGAPSASADAISSAQGGDTGADDGGWEVPKQKKKNNRISNGSGRGRGNNRSNSNNKSNNNTSSNNNKKTWNSWAAPPPSLSPQVFYGVVWYGVVWCGMMSSAMQCIIGAVLVSVQYCNAAQYRIVQHCAVLQYSTLLPRSSVLLKTRCQHSIGQVITC